MDIITRCWKEYDFEILNNLKDEGIIIDNGYKSKSIYFTEEGIKKLKN